MSVQPSVTLPAGALIRADLAGLLVGAGLGFAGTLVVGAPMSSAWVAALGAGLTGVVALLGTLIVNPARSRPILKWANLLITLATGRLAVSVGACLLLYFAAQMPAAPLLSGMLLTLLFVLITETRIAADCFSRATPAATNTDQADPPDS